MIYTHIHTYIHIYTHTHTHTHTHTDIHTQWDITLPSKRMKSWGTWVAQLVEPPTLDFCSGCDIIVVISPS